MSRQTDLMAIKVILARCGQGPEGGAVEPDPIVMLMVAKGFLTLTGVGATAVTTATGFMLLARLTAEEIDTRAAPHQRRAEPERQSESGSFNSPAVLPFKRSGEILRPVRAAPPPRHSSFG
jgi:hypothetical protein